MPRCRPGHEPVGSKAPAGHRNAHPRWLECCTSDIEPPCPAVDFARGALKRRKHRIRELVISSRHLPSSDGSVRAGAAPAERSPPRGRRNTNGSSQYRNNQHRNSHRTSSTLANTAHPSPDTSPGRERQTAAPPPVSGRPSPDPPSPEYQSLTRTTASRGRRRKVDAAAPRRSAKRHGARIATGILRRAAHRCSGRLGRSGAHLEMRDPSEHGGLAT